MLSLKLYTIIKIEIANTIKLNKNFMSLFLTGLVTLFF